MEAKALLIPLAAFALSATGVSAFNSDVLQKAGLTQEQISAFEQAHELRRDGDKDAAREVLQEAGIDLQTMESVREAIHKYKEAVRSAVDEAVENNDYEAFKIAIEDSPLADIITTQEDFELFSEAHKLHEEGEHQAAHEIMEDLGFTNGPFGGAFGHMMREEKMDGQKEGRFHGFGLRNN
jgi:tetratricopeptide (TPR) repeat protein